MRFRELPEQVSSIIEVKGNLTIVTLLHHSLYDHRQNPTTHLSSCAYQNGNTKQVLPVLVLTLQLSILCKGHQRLMLVGNLLIQDCIQAFLQHTANGRSLKAQCHHIMSINCQVLECEAALFLQDLIVICDTSSKIALRCLQMADVQAYLPCAARSVAG